MLLGTTGYKIDKMGGGGEATDLAGAATPLMTHPFTGISSRSYDWTQRWKTTVKTLRAKNPTTFTERHAVPGTALHISKLI